MNKTERISECDLFDHALSLVENTQIAGEPLCLAVDLEHVLLPPYYEGVDYEQSPPQPNPNFVNFLQQAVTRLHTKQTASKVIIANASSMVADPKTRVGLDYRSVEAYIESGEKILKKLGCRFARITDLAGLKRPRGVVVHFNDLQIYPSLARCTPEGWLTYASTVMPFSGLRDPVRVDDYLTAMINSFQSVDTEKVIIPELRARAAVLRSFR